MKEREAHMPESADTLHDAANGKKQNFMHGAAILTVGVVIMKLLGAICTFQTDCGSGCPR